PAPLSSIRPPPPRSTPSPYTTLFRSRPCAEPPTAPARPARERVGPGPSGAWSAGLAPAAATRAQHHSTEREQQQRQHRGAAVARSEEHTSELQSRENLVCRLLLEKKK